MDGATKALLVAVLVFVVATVMVITGNLDVEFWKGLAVGLLAPSPVVAGAAISKARR